MRVLIISAVFPPEPLLSAGINAEIACELSAEGHDVKVLTSFPNKPKGVVFPGFKCQWRFERAGNGYTIVHLWHSLSRKSSFLSRFWENLTFALTTSWEILRSKSIEAAYLDSWPLFSQSLNIIALRLKKARIVCAVQDIYPESLIDKGMINSKGWLSHGMLRLDKKLLDRSDIVVTLSPGMAQHLISTRNLGYEKVKVIPNWVDQYNFPYYPSTNGEFRQKHNISEDTFVALFAGSLTLSANVMMYVDTAEILRDKTDILIVLAGDGSLREELETDIKRRGLQNIRVIYPLNPSDVPLVQAGADVLLLSLKGTMSQSAAPSKQVSYMFSGRPILASISSDGHPAQIIREADCGILLTPENPDGVAQALKQLKDKRLELGHLGLNALKYAEKHFAKAKILPILAELILNNDR